MIVAQRWDYRRLRALAPMLVLVSLALLVAVLAIGPAGQRRAPLDLARPGGLPAVRAREALARGLGGGVLRRRARRRATCASCGARSARSRASSAVLLILEPDIGTAIALMLMLDAGCWSSRARRRACSARRSAIAGALGTVRAIWIEPYRRARFFAFLHPWHDAQGTGFQIVQAMIGMGSGHIFGVGLGQGVQKIFYLPEAHTDMMLANIGEELGLVGVAAVIGAYALFAYAGLDDRAAAAATRSASGSRPG